MKTDLDLIEAEANLKVAEEAMNRANDEAKGQQQPAQNDEQEHRIQAEFQKEPEVIALAEEIAAADEQLEHAKSLARQPGDPARRVADARCKKLWSEYEQLWRVRYDEISKQLKKLQPQPQGRRLSLSELRLKVAALKTKKEEQAKRYRGAQDRKEGSQ